MFCLFGVFIEKSGFSRWKINIRPDLIFKATLVNFFSISNRNTLDVNIIIQNAIDSRSSQTIN